jgi:AraC-like DNA-binding protein
MECIQLRIPPLPQLLTVGHSIWQPGNQHFRRSFGVYDMLLVKRGTLYMTEEDQAYAVGSGDLLVLEPGFTHWGHLPCTEETDIYWVHFTHSIRGTRITREQIGWSTLLDKGRDEDQSPSSDQHVYIPKWASVDLSSVTPVLDAMDELHNRLNAENAIRLHRLFAELFVLLQEECSRTSQPTQSARISAAAADLLSKRRRLPFEAGYLEEELHFQFDYITRCMKKHTGMTPLQYVLQLRLEEAKKLLTHTVLTIPEIAEQVGIGDTNYFVRLFSKKLGLPPGAYRRMQRPGHMEGGGHE